MRILFDGYWWASGPYSNRQVLREFIFAWQRLFPEDTIIVAVRADALDQAKTELTTGVRVVVSHLKPQGISAIVELPIIARREKADLTLSHNFSPLIGRSVVFVHDLMFVTNPEWFTGLERLYFSLMTLTLGRANLVVTSSNAEAARINSVGRARKPAVAIGLGFPGGLAEAAPVAPKEAAGAESFLLIVGRLNVRKNLANALGAAVRSGHIDPQHPLIVVGEPSGRGAELPADVRAAVADGAIRFTGFISDSELAWLYQNAQLFLFLSLDEGFGIPTLEALHFGTPVLASDIAVFHEILGEGASYVDPHSVDAIALAIGLALDGARTKRRDPVSAQQLGFSWGHSVSRFREAIIANARDMRLPQ